MVLEHPLFVERFSGKFEELWDQYRAPELPEQRRGERQVL